MNEDYIKGLASYSKERIITLHLRFIRHLQGFYMKRHLPAKAIVIGAVTATTSLIFGIPKAHAIDGPSVHPIPNTSWGSADDIWPHVVRVELDINGDGNFQDDGSFCTGTLIAPDLVATAGHCFDWVGANTAIPAGGVRLNFGPGATTQFFTNSGGQTHGIVAVTDPNDFAVVSIDTTNNATPASPIPILPRPARVGDTVFAIGYGVDVFNNQDNSDRIATVVDGFLQHNEAAKNWATLTVDNVTEDFIEQIQQSPENWTETGDSGGPAGILRVTDLPEQAYGSDVGAFQRGDFITSVVSGGPTPVTPDSSDPSRIEYDSSSPDRWTRIDRERNFIHDNATLSMLPTNLSIFHNLPLDLSLLAPNDPIKVFIRATYAPSALDYLLNINLWEEDDQSSGPFDFSGDVALRNTLFGDDLAGFGFSAGRFNGLSRDLVVWEQTTAQALFSFDDLLDPPGSLLDWVFQINYGDELQFANVTPSSLAAIDTQIEMALSDITAGNATRGGFAVAQVPEPSTLLSLLLAGISGIWIRRPRNRVTNK